MSEVLQSRLVTKDNTLLQRKNLWITSKLWNDCHSKDHVEEACRETIRNLRCEYLDLYLMHFPVCFKKGVMEATSLAHMDSVPVEETWKAMESLVEKGLVKNIGVSNFEVNDIKRVLKVAKKPIAVNQYELHPQHQRTELTTFCQQNGIAVTAHTSLGSPANPWSAFHPPPLMEDATVCRIAASTKRSPAQVLLRWAHQKGFSVIPKSVNEHRLLENSQIFDFSLTEQQMLAIDALDRGEEGRFNHPVTPWLGRAGFPDDKPTQRFKGVMAATLTPFEDGVLTVGSKDHPEGLMMRTDRQAQDLAKQGCAGVFVNGTTGEGNSMSVAERMFTLDAWANAGSVVDGRMDIICHIGAGNIEDTIELARHANEHIKSGRVKAIAVVMPAQHKSPDEQTVLKQLLKVSQQSGFPPMQQQHFPSITNVNISIHSLLVMAKRVLPSLIGAKFTHTDLGDFGLACSTGANMIIGGEDFFLPALVVGGEAAIGALFSFSGELHKAIADNQEKGDLKKADQMQQYARLLMKEVKKYMNHQPASFIPALKHITFKLRHI